jgi:hypothetical protein
MQFALALCFCAIFALGNAAPYVQKLEDVVIYKNDKFYSTFPSVVCRPNGELIVAFRRAPERRPFGEGRISHTDANSYLVVVRSTDHGRHWSEYPELMFAHPFGGAQDPCLLQLKDGTLLCSSYGWMESRSYTPPQLINLHRVGTFLFLGGLILHSKDGGHRWGEPIIPPATPGEQVRDPFGKPVPAYNRGAMCEGADGTIYWATASMVDDRKGISGTHLFTSKDKGLTWAYSAPISGSTTNVSFDETSLYETPKGDLIAFMRTQNLDDRTAIARSTNHGKSFLPWEDAGFQGHPHFALRLPNKEVLLVYGYRHAPFGVRARVLDPECTNISTAKEIVLRSDGANGDVGYPWATMISKNRALVVYYLNIKDGTRFIAGTILSVGK